MAQSQSAQSLIPESVIVSVPHTGTRFLKERLGIDEHVHTHTVWNTLTDRIRGKHIIVPLRSPVSVWRSWCRRREDKDPLIWAPQFFAAWYVLHTLDQLYDLDFICVDKCDDDRIKDWQKVGDDDSDHARWKLHKTDLRTVYQIPCVNQFYHSWRQK